MSSRFLHQRYVAESAPPEGLRLLTWNVGKVYLPWESRATERDLQHIAKVIRQVNPHVVALQELRDAEQLGRLLALLGRGWRGSIPKDIYDRRAALLIRLPGSFFAVTTTSGRIAQGASVKLREGREATIVSLHLDAFDAQRRLDQAQEIVSIARKRADERALFIAGDFNIDPTTAAKRSADDQLYGLLSKGFIDAGAHAGVTTIFSRRLDYVFVSREVVVESRAQVLKGRRVNTMDHDPLVVDARLLP